VQRLNQEERMNSTRHNSIAWIATSLALVAAAAVAAPASALTHADLRAGVYSDNGGVGLGGGVLTDMGARTNWYFNPNLEAAFGDATDQLAVNADFHYDFRSSAPYSAYLGAGPALLWQRPDRGETDTETGVNVLGGVVGKRGEVRPFVQMKGVIADRGQVALVGGIRF
jgi:hypothetical protein